MRNRHRKQGGALLGVVLLAAAMLLNPALPSSAQGDVSVFINEIHYDNDGTDAGEAIEIAGPAGMDLSGWSLVRYNGNGGITYGTDLLSGIIPDLCGGYGVVVVSYSTDGLQNGSPDGVALVDDSNAVVQFLSYEGSFTATDGPAVGLTSVDIGVSESSSTLVGESLQLSGTGSSYADFVWNVPQENSFGSCNPGQVFEGGIEVTPIYEVQYTDDPSGDSPMVGEAVMVKGLVTAVFSSGYFVEDPAGGAWNGLWVYSSEEVAVGDLVRASGTVDEYYGLTELMDLTALEVLSSGNTLPDPVLLATGDISQEQWEGVLVRVANVTVTNPDLSYDEWAVTDGSGDVVIDDLGDYMYVPVAGDALASVTGPLNFSYEAFKIAPRDDDDIVADGGPVSVQAFINEIHYDNVSTDSGEAIEIAGPAGMDLSGWSLVRYNGSGGAAYGTDLLEGSIPDLCGGYGVVVVEYSVNGLQNGAPDGVALVDATDAVVQFLSYEGSFTATDGPAVGLTSEDIGVSESGSTLLGDSLQLSGTGSSYADFVWNVPQENSFGSCNPGQVFEGGIEVTPIYEVQYTDDPSGDSPLIDQEVTIQGLVTAAFYNGYFVEDSAGGAWNGLWVYDSSEVAVGDLVRVSGTVAEYYGLTELVDVTAFEQLSSGNTLPDPVVLPTGDVSQEQWEGVLVRVEYVTVANPDLGYGEWSVTDGSGDVVIDDKGSYTYAPVQDDVLASVTGALDYSYGVFKIQPRDNDDITVIGACGDPATFIHEVQGAGDASPLLGTTVVIEGVVVGDFQGDGELDGFFLQEEDGDVDAAPETSEGIFVYAPGLSQDVSVGDTVRVLGAPTEYYGLTELGYVDGILFCGTGAIASAAVVTLPVASLDEWEHVEGMLIHFPQTLYVTENYNLGRYGQISLSVNDRLYNPTNVVEPGPDAIALQDLNDRSRIELDDGNTGQNVSPVLYLDGETTLRAGATTEGLTGVLNYSYDLYRVQRLAPVVFTPANAREPAPVGLEGNLTVASMNVLNYFTTLTSSGSICGPSGDMECRGADTAEELERQRAKIVSALAAMSADIVGLIEIENHATDAALQDLVAGLNEAVGADTYAYVETGPIGTDAIKVALIYRPEVVLPVGAYAILDSSVDPSFIDTKNRPALAQSFVQNETGETLTVVINHFKSKGSDCNDVGDPDTGDGQGNCNLTRTDAATALVNWLATGPTGIGDTDVLIMGDLNSYAKEDPIDAIKAGEYTDLAEALIGPSAYSYVFEGQSGYLDHALSSSSMTLKVAGVTEWHINADEPNALSYEDYNQVELYVPDPFRASDHDPVLVSFGFEPVVAAFVPSATNIFDDESVTFDNQSTGGDPLSYLWDFGDGTTSTESSPTHSWAVPGLYTVLLTVSHDMGSDTAEATILVRPREVPLEMFSVSQSSIVWSGRKGSAGRLQVSGWLALPEGYDQALLTHELEVALTVGGEQVSAEVELVENGPVWHFYGQSGDELDLTKAAIIWPKVGKDKAAVFTIVAKFAVDGVDFGTRPAEATVRLGLLVAGDELAERVVGEQLLAFETQGRVWRYIAPHFAR